MSKDPAKELGRRLRQRRQELGLSLRDLEQRTGLDNSTILRIEQGAFAAPRPDKLGRLADALGLELADVFALADYAVPDELPSFAPYLRTKYRDLPAPAVEELEHSFRRITERYGYQPEGPAPGEDEEPEIKQNKSRKGGDHDQPSTPGRNPRNS